MKSSDIEMVRRFVESGSELAFAAVVEGYAGLVYSTALRIVGSPALAQDVAQSVFLDLLRKTSVVRGLIQRESSVASGPAILAGWLHRATRYEAMETIRSETRRKNREQFAMANQCAEEVSEVPWDDLAPMLDEALDELDEPDRRALLLRYFQQSGFREIGAALGVSDDAAQKRVSRAVEQLRTLFARKGVAVSAVALGVSMTSHAIEALPASLANNIAATAWQSLPAPAPSVAPQKPWRWRVGLTSAGAIAIVLILFLVEANSTVRPVTGTGQRAFGPQNLSRTPVSQGVEVMPGANDSRPLSAPGPQMGLKLQVLSDETGAPVAGVKVFAAIFGEVNQGFPPLETDAQGVVWMNYPTNLKTLQFILQREGLANKQLSWTPERGQTIPPEFTVRLERGKVMGGFVLDDTGAPVANATVRFQLVNESPSVIGSIESIPPHGRTFSDAMGVWRTDQFTEATLPGLQGSASHKDYPPDSLQWFAKKQGALHELKEGRYVFRLERGLPIRGKVLDANGKPAAGVPLTVGDHGSYQASGISMKDGSFVVKGCRPGHQILTAYDETRGVGFQLVDVTTNAGPIALKLEPFRTLQVLALDSSGRAIPEVEVTWSPISEKGTTMNRRQSIQGEITAQYRFHGVTTAEGKLTWNHAPTNRVFLDLRSKQQGWRRDVEVEADGTLQTIVLEDVPPPRYIRGSVRDAVTGKPIAPIRTHEIHPHKLADGTFEPVWPWSPDHIKDFAGSEFELRFENPLKVDANLMDQVIGITAEGYEKGISRIVSGKENNATLVFDLRPVSSASAKAQSGRNDEKLGLDRKGP